MNAGIPFVDSAAQLALATKHFTDAPLIRVPLDRWQADRGGQFEPSAAGFRIWVDPVVDGVHSLREVARRKRDPFSRKTDEDERGQHMWEPYAQWLTAFEKHRNLVRERPALAVIQPFVDDILDACLEHEPDWISVPQLPLCAGASRNRVNTQLSECTRIWQRERSFKGTFVLPVIISRFRDVYDKKTVRNAKMTEIEKCIGRSGAEVIWVVDAELDDQKGSDQYQNRFAQLVNLHKEIRGRFDRSLQVVAGPYWGMNLVLWARGLADNPAVSMGVGYRYRISGLTGRRGKTRVVLPPLRRWAVAQPALRAWIAEAGDNRELPGDARDAFRQVVDEYSSVVADERRAKETLVKFCRSWFDGIADLRRKDRALALFQDLTNAYAIGTTLPDLPKNEGPGRRPERVAQQLMLNCL